MRLFVVFATLALVVSTSDSLKLKDIDTKWVLFLKKFGKTYRNVTETLRRKDIFKTNLERIVRHNAEADAGKHTYWLKVTEHADLTLEEFYAKLSGFNANLQSNEHTPLYIYKHNSSIKTPASFDWRSLDKITPVKNQGRCGSCYSFATNAAIEAQYKIKYNKTLDLSEQQSVDCSQEFNNKGCEGGLMTSTYGYYMKSGGVVAEKDYPYTFYQGSCKFDSSKVAAQISGYVNIDTFSEKALEQAVVNQGPVAVGILALDSLYLYSHGVYYERQCNTKPFQLNHAVLVVGHGSVKSGLVKNYWIVKNSWGETVRDNVVLNIKSPLKLGTSWGQDGYGWMAKDAFNNCGIASLASFPVIN